MDNLEQIYKPLVDAWAVYDNSGITPQLLEQGQNR
jgi:predicted ABC-type ATPase